MLGVFVVILFWLKFRKGKKHKIGINNSSELFDFLNTALFVLITISSIALLPLLSTIFSNITNNQVHNYKDFSTYLIFIESLALIFILIYDMKSKNQINQYLKAIPFLTGLYLIIVQTYILLIIKLQPLDVISKIILYVSIVFLTFVVCFLHINLTKKITSTNKSKPNLISPWSIKIPNLKNKLFEIKKKQIQITEKCSLFLLYVIISLFIFLIYFLILLPHTRETSELISYKVEHKMFTPYFFEYKTIQISKEIKNFGYLNSKNSHQRIMFYYSSYNFSSDSFKLIFEDNKQNITYEYTSKTQKWENSYSTSQEIIANISIKIDKHIVIIDYQIENLQNITHIYLVGQSQVNMSSNLFYYDHNFEREATPCTKNQCTFEINISNHLDKPLIIAEDDRVFVLHDYVSSDNLAIQNASTCKLKNLTTTVISTEYFAKDFPCDERGCDSTVRFKDNSTKQIIPNIYLHIYNGDIHSQEITINNPIDLSLKLLVTCD
jgi:hypothetical protein